MQEVDDSPSPAEVHSVLAGLKSREPRERRLSARRFGALRLNDPFGILRPLLDDPDPNIRLAAVDALEDITDQRAPRILLKMASADSSQDVREASLQELGKYRSEEILDFLLSEARRIHRSRRPRQLIAEQLKNYDTEASVDALLMLAQDRDVYVQERAIDSLFHLNRPRLREFWALISRDWKGTYWGKLARDALRDLHGSKAAKRNARSQARPQSSRARLLPKKMQARRSAGQARQTAGVVRQQAAAVRVDEALRRLVSEFVVKLRHIIYSEVLEEVHHRLAAMAPYRGQAREAQAPRQISSNAGAWPRMDQVPAVVPRARVSQRRRRRR